jgi:hypothetical protein
MDGIVGVLVECRVRVQGDHRLWHHRCRYPRKGHRRHRRSEEGPRTYRLSSINMPEGGSDAVP